MARVTLERKTGFEPATFSLARRCSTTEPLPRRSFQSMIARRPDPVNSTTLDLPTWGRAICGDLKERDMPDSILPGTLVSPEWLAERLTDPGLRVADIRGYVKTEDLGEGRQHAEYVGARDEYDRDHIPGSVFVDWTTDIVDPNNQVKAQLAPADRFAEAMSQRGIGDETDVVVVDHTGGHFATRLWWALNRWKTLGLPLTDAVPEVQRRRFTPQERPSLRVEAEELLSRISEQSNLVVDARDPSQYTGA